MRNKALRGLIVEDDPLIADEIQFCLKDLGYETMGPVFSVGEALSVLEAFLPDFVMLDIHLGEGQRTGIELAKIINLDYYIPFIFLTAYADDMTLREVKETLPAGFVVKPFNEKRLKAAIHVALHNYYSVLKLHLETLKKIDQSLIEPLTPREQELLQLLCSGKSNQGLADHLFVSINTIKTHLKNLYLKLGVNNRAEVMLMMRNLIQG